MDVQTDNLFHWAGEQIGRLIRAVVGVLGWLFGHLYGAIDAFVDGLTGALGISSSILSLLLLVIGLALLLAGVQALFRRRVVAAVIWGLLGVLLLSWLIQ